MLAPMTENGKEAHLCDNHWLIGSAEKAFLLQYV